MNKGGDGDVSPVMVRLDDARKMLGVSIRHIYNLRKRGEFFVVKSGAAVLVPMAEVRRYGCRKEVEHGQRD